MEVEERLGRRGGLTMPLLLPLDLGLGPGVEMGLDLGARVEPSRSLRPGQRSGRMEQGPIGPVPERHEELALGEGDKGARRGGHKVVAEGGREAGCGGGPTERVEQDDRDETVGRGEVSCAIGGIGEDEDDETNHGEATIPGAAPVPLLLFGSGAG